MNNYSVILLKYLVHEIEEKLYINEGSFLKLCCFWIGKKLIVQILT